MREVLRIVRLEVLMKFVRPLLAAIVFVAMSDRSIAQANSGGLQPGRAQAIRFYRHLRGSKSPAPPDAKGALGRLVSSTRPARFVARANIVRLEPRVALHDGQEMPCRYLHC